jgi:protein-L-isoaspartate(D-aspartate) O-methyltransferase
MLEAGGEGPAMNSSEQGGNSGLDVYERERRAMVREQVRDRGLCHPRVLDAMLAVPRHLFVPLEHRAAAYADQPLPIGEGQTISQPFMVAAMSAALDLTGAERVLEIGTGSGYQAAVLSLLAREVYSVERVAALADAAQKRLTRLGYANVFVRTGDGTLGWPEAAPWDAIVVTAAAPRVPQPLVEQLAEGGRLVIPVGDAQQQELLLVRRLGARTDEQLLHYCRFVPLVGRHGWPGPQ